MKLKQRRIWHTADESFIRLEWGSMQRIHHFTKEFRAKHKEFCKYYESNHNKLDKKTIYSLLTEIEDSKIKIVLYDGLTNRCYKNTAEVWRYFVHYWISDYGYSRERQNA